MGLGSGRGDVHGHCAAHFGPRPCDHRHRSELLRDGAAGRSERRDDGDGGAAAAEILAEPRGAGRHLLNAAPCCCVQETHRDGTADPGSREPIPHTGDGRRRQPAAAPRGDAVGL
jgi:hypothetical protein